MTLAVAAVRGNPSRVGAGLEPGRPAARLALREPRG